MSSAAVWSVHEAVQPNAANEVPADAEAAAAFFRCLTYRCGMMGQACAARYQRRAAGPVLGQVDQLDGCNACPAGAARAALLGSAPGKKVVRVSIAQPRMSRPIPKFQPVLASRADRNLRTAEVEPCAACNATRHRLTRKRIEGPYANLCATCERNLLLKAQRQARIRIEADRDAWIEHVAKVSGRLRAAMDDLARTVSIRASIVAAVSELLGRPISMPPVLYVPVAPCAKCGRARNRESIGGEPTWCNRCNDKAEEKARAKERKAALAADALAAARARKAPAKPRKTKAERAKAVAAGIAATKAQAKADVEAAMEIAAAPRLPDPIPPCSKCGRPRFFKQKRRREVGDPTVCSRCNRHVHRALRRQERYGEKIAALQARLAAASAGETSACPRCLRESRRSWDRAGSVIEPFCSECINVSRRFVPGGTDAQLLAWLSEHPSRRDHGSACRGCGAMRHCVGDGINGEWCSRCRKNAANTVKWHGVPVTEELVHQQLLRNEARAKRAKRLPIGRVAEAVTEAVVESMPAQAPAVPAVAYFDATRLAISHSAARWRLARSRVEFHVHRDGEYLIVAAEAS